jgi:MFS family permease
MLARVRGLARYLGKSASAFKEVVGNPDLRRLELAWAFAIIGHWAYTIAVSVYAYEVGGSSAVGLVFALRLFSAALVAPFAGMLADRYRRELILLGSSLIRIVLMGAAAVCVFLDTSPVVVYALAVAAAIATAPFRSAQAALMPALAKTPSQLTGANAVVSTIESLAIFVGPALAGFLLAVTSAGVVFAVNAAMLAVTAVFVARIRAPRVKKDPEIEAGTIVAEALAGFRVIGRDPPLRILTALLAAQTLILGALEVYIVVMAFELLDQGAAGVGILNSIMGIGALVGGVVALSLAGSRRLSPPFAIGVLLVGAPLVLLGIWPEAVLIPLLLAVVAIGSTVLDVAGFTLVQRVVPDQVMARVFGVIQMLFYVSLALGAAVAPALIGSLDIRGALIATGAVLVVVMLLLWRPLARIDATAAPPDASELRLLTSIPIFAPLPGASLEHLAGRLVPLKLDTGAEIVREGDDGDRFYIIAEGEVDVSQDGTPVSTLQAGDHFGEIALIRRLPRTASVTARSPVVLYALDRDDFLAAVTGHPPSAEAAESVVSARLTGGGRPGVRPASP